MPDEAELIPPKADRRCQVSSTCSYSGPCFPNALLVLGTPPVDLTGVCHLCDLVVCGSCANKVVCVVEPVQITVRLLSCPLCGSPLGGLDRMDGYTLVSAKFGVLGTLIGPLSDGRLLSPLTQNTVSLGDAVDYHQRNAWRILHAFNTERCIDAMIGVADSAVEESPSDVLSWAFKALLSQRAGYSVAAAYAQAQVKTLPSTPLEHVGFSVTELVLSPSVTRWWQRFAIFHTSVRVRLLRRLACCEKRLNARATRRVNQNLAQFHSQVLQYREGRSSLGDHLLALYLSAETRPPSVARYLDSIVIDQSLDQSKVDKELRLCMEILVPTLLQEEIQGLAAVSVAYQCGSASRVDYYRHFASLVRNKGQNLNDCPNLNAYVELHEIVSLIEARELYDAVWDAEQVQYSERCTNKEERQIVKQLTVMYLSRLLLEYVSDRLSSWRLDANEAPHPLAFEELVKHSKHNPLQNES